MPSPPLPLDYQLSCVWSARPQDAQSCAASLQAFLAALAPACPDGTRWYTVTRKHALLAVPLNDADALRMTVLKPGNGAPPGAAPDAIFTEVGFHALLVSDEAEAGCAIRLHWGMGGPHAHNELTLTFPCHGEAFETWVTTERVQALFECCLSCWRPDIAYVHHTDMRDEDVGYPLPVYWYAYSRSWPEDLPRLLGELPAGAQIRHDSVAGPYLVTTSGRYNRFDDTHRIASDALKARLKSTGLHPSPSPFL